MKKCMIVRLQSKQVPKPKDVLDPKANAEARKLGNPQIPMDATYCRVMPAEAQWSANHRLPPAQKWLTLSLSQRSVLAKALRTLRSTEVQRGVPLDLSEKRQ